MNKRNRQHLIKQKWVVFIATTLFAFHVTTSTAQELRILREPCLHEPEMAGPHFGAPMRATLNLKTDWDSTRTYPVAVILVEFADKAFSMDDPIDRYNRIFNEEGYNEGKGAGCVADYFRCQSDGYFKPHFDIYGPVKVTYNSADNGKYGADLFHDATKQLYDSLQVDFAPYDWDGDAKAETIIYIFSGYGGNEVATEGKGYIWPNTSSFNTLKFGGISISKYSAIQEIWSNDRLSGIGTICHEFSHSLGLPDIYPTLGSEYSVVDEWDLMDGGNFINNGWCPPNFSIHEKMLLGWATPEELLSPSYIDQLAPMSQGGKAYIIRTDNDNEFFLLENRQWKGWDLRTPGHGLIITHVDYDSYSWTSNRVNSNPSHHRYDIIHADNRTYKDWEAIIGDENPRVGGHSRILSGSPYPYLTDSISNYDFTDTSVPAAVTFSGTGLLGKPIFAITENEDGTISFSFMEDFSTITPKNRGDMQSRPATDLLGRKAVNGHKGLIVKEGRIIFIK